MASAFGVFALWFLLRGNYSWLGAAILSQVPFWVGMLAFLASTDAQPVHVNAITNLMAAGAFAHWAERLQNNNRGGIVHIWLCILFLVMCSMDALQMIAPFSLYVLSQEIAHYLALFIIGGRAYVKRFDGLRRNSMHTHHTAEDRDLA